MHSNGWVLISEFDMENHDLYALDNEHPIPNLDVIDINTVKKTGGSDLFIVVATPLSDDRRSLERLLRKIENYLEFLQSDGFRTENGVPNPENTSIVVKMHPDSSASAFGLLERNKQWVKNNNATLVIDTQF